MIRKILLIFILFSNFVLADTKLVQVIVDNSGIIHDESDPKGKTVFNDFLKNFFYDLSRKHRRDRNDTTIQILSSNEPPRIVWTGSASNFSRKGIESVSIKNLYVNKAGCNDIPTAIEDAFVSKSINKTDINTLYIITTGVHSGPKCDNLTQEKYLELLTSADKNLIEKINASTSNFDIVSVQFLTSPQRRLFYSSIKNQRLRDNLTSQGQNPKIY